MRRNRLVPLLALQLLAAPLAAQDDAYLDPTARELVARSREARGRLGDEILSYEAVVLQRMSSRLRAPLRDRLLGRLESAMRVRWSRDGTTVVQMLGGRAENMGETPHVPMPELDPIFDPDADRFNFGIDIVMSPREEPAAAADSSSSDSASVSVSIGTGGVKADIEGDAELDGFWIAHPLAEGSERYYRYRSGDTLTLRLPTGRTVRMVELSAIPRAASFHHLRASLWLEPETGALVRAIFRPARDLDIQRDTAFVDAEDVDDLNVIPGVLRPIVIDAELITIEYSLWDQRHWLPHRQSITGSVRAGVLRIPFERETSYRFEEVNDEGAGVPRTSEEVVAAWSGAGDMELDTIRMDSSFVIALVPRDSAALMRSDELPPPVWEDAPAFASSAEMEELGRRLFEGVPGLTAPARPTLHLQSLLGGRGLVRYNRIEALSLGVRGVIDHALARGYATVRLGAADLHPNVELGALVPRYARAWRIEGYHRLTTVEPLLPGFEAPEPALGFGNSVNALLFGQDDGLYFRESGLTIAIEPRPQDRQSWRIAAYFEHHDDADRKVEWNVASWLDDDRKFEPNIDVDGNEYLGATLLLRPWWGVGTGPQAGLELFGEAANAAAFDGWDPTIARARVTARTLLPLTSRLRLGAEAAAGTAWGEMPVQYLWFLGGTETLRGYQIGDAAGESMARGRLEVAAGYPTIGLSLFSDAAWAGRRRDFDTDDALVSVGAGFTLMDGLLRIDVARALVAPTGWRVHFYLDALL